MSNPKRRWKQGFARTFFARAGKRSLIVAGGGRRRARRRRDRGRRRRPLGCLLLRRRRRFRLGRSRRRSRGLAAAGRRPARWRRAARLGRHDADRRGRGGARKIRIGGPARRHRRRQHRRPAPVAGRRWRIPCGGVAGHQHVIGMLVHVGDDLVVVGQGAERRALRRRAAVARQQHLRHQAVAVALDRPAQRLAVPASWSSGGRGIAVARSAA